MSSFTDDAYVLTRQMAPVLEGHTYATCIAALLAYACTLIESQPMHDAPDEVVLFLATSRAVVAALDRTHAYATMRES